ncbi:MAG: hypothetical protein ACI8XO_001619 [Verrucomicrobiales bacterium]
MTGHLDLSRAGQQFWRRLLRLNRESLFDLAAAKGAMIDPVDRNYRSWHSRVT